jgi:hypothetical protein
MTVDGHKYLAVSNPREKDSPPASCIIGLLLGPLLLRRNSYLSGALVRDS